MTGLRAVLAGAGIGGVAAAVALGRNRIDVRVYEQAPPRGAHDLIIAAHAAETGRMILSRDAKTRFGDLPGVSAIDA